LIRCKFGPKCSDRKCKFSHYEGGLKREPKDGRQTDPRSMSSRPREGNSKRSRSRSPVRSRGAREREIEHATVEKGVDNTDMYVLYCDIDLSRIPQAIVQLSVVHVIHVVLFVYSRAT
jgi:hypothetical protein